MKRLKSILIRNENVEFFLWTPIEMTNLFFYFAFGINGVYENTILIIKFDAYWQKNNTKS